MGQFELITPGRFNDVGADFLENTKRLRGTFYDLPRYRLDALDNPENEFVYNNRGFQGELLRSFADISSAKFVPFRSDKLLHARLFSGFQEDRPVAMISGGTVFDTLNNFGLKITHPEAASRIYRDLGVLLEGKRPRSWRDYYGSASYGIAATVEVKRLIGQADKDEHLVVASPFFTNVDYLLGINQAMARGAAVTVVLQKTSHDTQRDIADYLNAAGAEVYFGLDMHEKIVSISSSYQKKFSIGSVNLTSGPSSGDTFDAMFTLKAPHSFGLHEQYVNYIRASRTHERYNRFRHGRFGDIYKPTISLDLELFEHHDYAGPGYVNLPTRLNEKFFDLFNSGPRPKLSIYSGYYRAITGEADKLYWTQQFDRELADGGLGHALNRLVGFKLYHQGDGVVNIFARASGRLVDIAFGHYDHRLQQREGSVRAMIAESSRANETPPGFFESAFLSVSNAIAGTAISSFAYVATTFRHYLLSELEERGFNYLLNVDERQMGNFRKIATHLMFGDYHGEVIVESIKLMQKDPKLNFLLAREQFSKQKYGNANPVLPYDFGEGFNMAGLISASRRAAVSNLDTILSPLLRLIVPEGKHEKLEEVVKDLRGLIGQKISLGLSSADGGVTTVTKVIGIGKERTKAIANVLDRIADLVPANVFMWSPSLRKVFGFSEDIPYRSVAQVMGVGFMGRMVDAYQAFVHNLVDYVADPKTSIKRLRSVFKMERALATKEANLIGVVNQALMQGVGVEGIRNLLDGFISGRNKAINKLTQASKDAINLNILGQPVNDTKAFRLMLITGAAMALNYLADAFLLRAQGVSLTTQLGLFTQVHKKDGRAVHYEFEGNVTPMTSLLAGTVAGVISGFMFPKVVGAKPLERTKQQLLQLLQKENLSGSVLAAQVHRLGATRAKIQFNTGAALIGGAVGVLSLKTFAVVGAWALNQHFNKELGYHPDADRVAASGSLISAINALYQKRRVGGTSVRNYTDEMVMDELLKSMYISTNYGQTDQMSIAHQITLPFMQLAVLMRSLKGIGGFDRERIGNLKSVRELSFGIQLAPTVGIGATPLLPFGFVTGNRVSLLQLRLQERVNAYLRVPIDIRDHERTAELSNKLIQHAHIDEFLSYWGINKITYTKGSSYETTMQFIGAMTMLSGFANPMINWLEQQRPDSAIGREYRHFRDLVNLGKAIGGSINFVGSMLLSMPISLSQGVAKGINAMWIPSNLGAAGMRNRPDHLVVRNTIQLIRNSVNAFGPKIRAGAPFLLTSLVALAATDPVTGMFRNEMNKFEDDNYRAMAVVQLTAGIGFALHSTGVFANQERLLNMSDRSIVRRLLGIDRVFKELKYGEVASKTMRGKPVHFTGENNIYRNAKRAALASAVLYGVHLAALTVSHVAADSGPEALQNLYNIFPALQILSGVDAQQFNGRPKDNALSRILHSIQLGPLNLGQLFGLYKDDPDPFLALLGPAGVAINPTRDRVKYYEQIAGSGTKDLSVAFTSAQFLKSSFERDEIVKALLSIPEGANPNYVAALIRGTRPRLQAMRIQAYTGYEEDAATPLISMMLQRRSYQIMNLRQQRPSELLLDLLRDTVTFRQTTAQRTGYRGFDPYNFSTYLHVNGKPRGFSESPLEDIFSSLQASYGYYRRTLYPSPLLETGRASSNFNPITGIFNNVVFRAGRELSGIDEGVLMDIISLPTAGALVFSSVYSWLNTALVLSGSFAMSDEMLSRITAHENVIKAARYLEGTPFMYQFEVHKVDDHRRVYQRLKGTTPKFYEINLNNVELDPEEVILELNKRYRSFYRSFMSHHNKVLFGTLLEPDTDLPSMDLLLGADTKEKRRLVKQAMIKAMRQDIGKDISRTMDVFTIDQQKLNLFDVLHDLNADHSQSSRDRLKQFLETVIPDTTFDDLDSVLDSSMNEAHKRMHIKSKVMQKYVKLGVKLAHSGTPVPDSDVLKMVQQELSEEDLKEILEFGTDQKSVVGLLKSGFSGMTRLLGLIYPVSVGYTFAESLHYLGSSRRRLRTEAGEQMVRFGYETAMVYAIDRFLSSVLPRALQFGGWAPLGLSIAANVGLEFLKHTTFGQGVNQVENLIINRLGSFVSLVADLPIIRQGLGLVNFITRPVFDSLGLMIAQGYNTALKSENPASMMLAQWLLPRSLHKRDVNMRQMQTYAGGSPLLLGDASAWDEYYNDQRVQQLLSGGAYVSESLLHPEVWGRATGFRAELLATRLFDQAGVDLPPRILQPFARSAWQPSSLVRMLLQRRQHYVNSFVIAHRLTKPQNYYNASLLNQLLLGSAMITQSAFRQGLPLRVLMREQYQRFMQVGGRVFRPLRGVFGELRRIFFGSGGLAAAGISRPAVPGLGQQLLSGLVHSGRGALDDLFGTAFRSTKRGLSRYFRFNLRPYERAFSSLLDDAGGIFSRSFSGFGDFALRSAEYSIVNSGRMLRTLGSTVHHVFVRPVVSWVGVCVKPFLIPRVRFNLEGAQKKLVSWLQYLFSKTPSRPAPAAVVDDGIIMYNPLDIFIPLLEPLVGSAGRIAVRGGRTLWGMVSGLYKAFLRPAVSWAGKKLGITELPRFSLSLKGIRNLGSWFLHPEGTQPNYDALGSFFNSLLNTVEQLKPDKPVMANFDYGIISRVGGGILRGLMRMAPALMQLYTVNPERTFKLNPYLHNREEWRQAYSEYVGNLVSMRVGTMTAGFGPVTSLITGLLAGKFAEQFGPGLAMEAYQGQEAKHEVDRKLLVANLASMGSLALDNLLTPVTDFGVNYFDVTSGVNLSSVVQRMQKAHIFTRSGIAGRLFAGHELAHKLQYETYLQRTASLDFELDLITPGPSVLRGYYQGKQLKRMHQLIVKISHHSAVKNLDGLVFNRAQYLKQLALEKDAWFHSISRLLDEYDSAVEGKTFFNLDRSAAEIARLKARGRQRIFDLLKHQARLLEPAVNSFSNIDIDGIEGRVYRLYAGGGGSGGFFSVGSSTIRVKKRVGGLSKRLRRVRLRSRLSTTPSFFDDSLDQMRLQSRASALLNTIGTGYDIVSFLLDHSNDYLLNMAASRGEYLSKSELMTLSKAKAEPFYAMLISLGALASNLNPVVTGILGIGASAVSSLDPLGVGSLIYGIQHDRHARGETSYLGVGIAQVIGLNQDLSRYQTQAKGFFNMLGKIGGFVRDRVFSKGMLHFAALGVASLMISPIVARMLPGRGNSDEPLRPWVFGSLLTVWGINSAVGALKRASLDANSWAHGIGRMLLRDPFSKLKYSQLKTYIRLRRFGSKVLGATLLSLVPAAFINEEVSDSHKYTNLGVWFVISLAAGDVLQLPPVTKLIELFPGLADGLGRLRLGRVGATLVGAYALSRVVTLPWQDSTERLYSYGIVGGVGVLSIPGVRRKLQGWGGALVQLAIKARGKIPSWMKQIESYRKSIGVANRIMFLTGAALVLVGSALYPSDNFYKPWATGLATVTVAFTAFEGVDMLLRSPNVRSYLAAKIAALKSKFPLIGNYHWSNLKYVPDRLYDWLVHDAVLLKTGVNFVVNSLIGAAVVPRNPILGTVFGGLATAITAPGLLPSIGKGLSGVYSFSAAMLQKTATWLKSLPRLPKMVTGVTLGLLTAGLITASLIKDRELTLQVLVGSGAVSLVGFGGIRFHNWLARRLSSAADGRFVRFASVGTTGLIRGGMLAGLAYLATGNPWLTAGAGLYGLAMTGKVSDFMGEHVYAPALKLLGFSAAGYAAGQLLGYGHQGSMLVGGVVGGLTALQIASRTARIANKTFRSRLLYKLGGFDRMIGKLPVLVRNFGTGVLAGAGIGFIASKLMGFDSTLGLAGGALIGASVAHMIGKSIKFGVNKFFALQTLISAGLLGWEGYGLVKGVFERDYGVDEAKVRMGSYYSTLASIFSMLATNNNPFASVGLDFALSELAGRYGELRGANIAHARLGNAYLARAAIADTAGVLRLGVQAFRRSPFGMQFIKAGGQVVGRTTVSLLSQIFRVDSMSKIPGWAQTGVNVSGSVVLGTGRFVLRSLPYIAIGFNVYNAYEATNQLERMRRQLDDPRQIYRVTGEGFRAASYEQTSSITSAALTTGTVVLAATGWSGPIGWGAAALAVGSAVGIMTASHVVGSIMADQAEREFVERRAKYDPSFRDVYWREKRRAELKQQDKKTFEEYVKEIHNIRKREGTNRPRSFNPVVKYDPRGDLKPKRITNPDFNAAPPPAEVKKPKESPTETVLEDDYRAGPDDDVESQPKKSPPVKTSIAPKPSEQTSGMGDAKPVLISRAVERKITKEGKVLVASYVVPDWVLNQQSAMGDLPLAVFAPPEAPELAILA